MTEIQFHFNVPDRLVYTCRLLRKALRSGTAGVTVTGAPATLARLDRGLWTFADLEFLPHLLLRRGESVPPRKVAVSMERLDEADALLVVGSSLTVWSGFRFVKRAAERGIPVAIVNIGPTRGDELAAVKVDGECGAVLSAALDAIRSA